MMNLIIHLKRYESYMQERERRVGPTQIPVLNRTELSPVQNYNFQFSITNKKSKYFSNYLIRKSVFEIF